MRKAKVAIITRTKDRTLLLRRAIESVLSQTFEDWNMVIVNDGGDPEELNSLIVKYENNFQGRYQIFHNKHSVGMEAASNIGIKNSDSDYVVIHDDDDSWDNKFLEKCVFFLKENQFPSIAGVITYTTRILESVYNNHIKKERSEPYNTWLQAVTIYRMAASNVFPPISFLYKREVFDSIGYYREDLPVLGDWEFNLRFIKEYDIALIPELLAYYHHRVQMPNGILSNSVIKDDSQHKFYDYLLRNELLRKDLHNNQLGMGYLVNLTQSFEILHGQVAPFENLFKRIKQNKTAIWIKRLFNKFIN